MLKIHHHFVINFLALFFGTLVIAALIGYLTLKSLMIEHSEDDLKRTIEIVQLQLNEHGDDDIDAMVKNYHQMTNMRITIIDENGVVIAESDTDKDMMENHANRYEVMQSASNDYGVATRYSNTIKTDFLYVAKRIDFRGERVTLRMSMSLEKIFESYAAITVRLMLVMLLFIVIAGYISHRLSGRIQQDINEVIRYLEEIGNKNYKAVIKPQHFSEFLLIALQLKNLVKKLSNREKQKRKYTAKLRLVNKQRNDILSAISHEFKNPVASIMGYAETLHDDPEVDIKIRTRFLDKILSNGKKIATMLDRLALSVKLENNDVKVSKSEFDLCELVDEVIQNMGKKYKNRSILSECQSIRVNADKTTIEMVLINLLDNALKYSELEVAIIISENRLMVVDKGMGIAEKELEKISSKFYRVEKNTWDNSLGLGLAIVGYILSLHHSRLKIESEVGVGSTFSFDLEPLLVQA